MGVYELRCTVALSAHAFVYPHVHTSSLLYTCTITLSVTVPVLLDTTFYYWGRYAISPESTSDGAATAAAQS